MDPVARANGPRVGTNRLVQLLGQWSNVGGPLYAALSSAIVSLIDDGSLHAGDRLPPERRLSDALSVSRGTVVRAYDALSESGHVVRVQGSGTTVRGTPMKRPSSAEEFVGDRLWLRDGSAVNMLMAVPSIQPAMLEEISRVDPGSVSDDLDTTEPLGWWRLRCRIAELHDSQGLPTTPHQILVCSGAQQTIALTVAATVGNGDVVVGEERTWPGLIDAVRGAGARFEPVRMDGAGLVVEDLESKVERYRPALVAINPQHQNPTGTRLPAERVEAVASIAARHRLPVLEDRVSADLGFDSAHLPAIDEFDTGGYGMTATSVSKVAWAGLRFGWLRADVRVINRLRSHRALADLYPGAMNQLLGLAVLERYEELVEWRASELRPRAELVAEVLRDELPQWHFSPARGGLSLWATLPEEVSASAFVQHAGHHGVLLASGKEFSAGGSDSNEVRIPFTYPAAHLREGLTRMVEAWHTFDRMPTPVGVM